MTLTFALDPRDILAQPKVKRAETLVLALGRAPNLGTEALATLCDALVALRL